MKTMLFSNYENASSAIEALKKSFQEEVPPISVTFNTKSEVDIFANLLCPVKERKYVTGYSFSCKHSKTGMSLIFKGYEMKSFPDSYYPITIRFKSYEEVLDFADDYAGVLVPKTAEDYKAFGKFLESEREAMNTEKELCKRADNKHARLGLITCLSMFVIAICTMFLLVVRPITFPQIKQLFNPSNSSAEKQMYQNVVGTWKTKFEESYTSPNSYAILYEYVTFNSNRTGKCDFTLETPGIISNHSKGFGFKWRMNGDKIEVLVDDDPGWETGYYYKGGSSITDIDGRSFEKTLR